MAQTSSLKSKIFHGFGYAASYGTAAATSFKETEYYYSWWSNTTTVSDVNYYDARISYGSFLSLYYQLRVNLVEFSDESSFSIELNPTVDIAAEHWASNVNYSETGFKLPVLASYNINTGATKSSWANTGFSIGIGINYISNAVSTTSYNRNSSSSY